MMGIAVCGKDEKVGTDTRCRAVVRVPDSEEVAGGIARRRRGMTDVARSRARKCALASLCIFQETRVRRAAIKWHETDRIPAARGRQLLSVRSRVSFVPPVPSRMPTTRFIQLPRLSRRFYTSSALLLPQFSAAKPGEKLLMPGITRRKPQLRRFERLTAMRAISSRGWLSAGRSERWTRRKNAKDSRDICRTSLDFLISKIQIIFIGCIKILYMFRKNNNFLLSNIKRFDNKI